MQEALEIGADKRQANHQDILSSLYVYKCIESLSEQSGA
jgi:hypothetical protein